MNKPSAYSVYLILSGASTLFNATMFTVQAVYYVQAVSMNPLQLVLVGTVMEVVVFLFEVPTGVVADTYSRRLSVIIGTFVTGVGFLLQGLIPRYGAILLGIAIWGIGATFLSGAREAWIADEVGEEHISHVFLRTTQVRQVAALVGTFASVGLASIQINLPIVLGASLTIALGVFLLFAMPERGFKPIPREKRTSWQALSGTLRDGVQVVRRSIVLLALLGVSIFSGAASEGMDRLRDAHLLANFTFPTLGMLKPVVWFGVISAGAQILSSVAIQIFRGRLEAISQRPVAIARVLLIFEGLSVVSIIIFGLAGSFALALGAYWARATVGALAGPLYSTWLVQNINPKVRATVISMSSLTNAFGQAAGGPVIGAVGTTFSLRAAMVVTGALLSPALLLYASVSRSDRTAPDLTERNS